MLLFFIRHGQTTANVKDQLYGQLEYPLTSLGRQQAQALQPLLEKFCFDRVYTSDLTRAVETAKLAIPGCAPIQTPLVREFDIGSIAPITRGDFNRLYPQVGGDFRPFGGEDIPAVAQRLRSFLAMLENDPVERVAVFSHSGTLKCMVRLVLGMDIHAARLQNHNCNVAVFRHTAEGWQLAAWNLAGQL